MTAVVFVAVVAALAALFGIRAAARRRHTDELKRLGFVPVGEVPSELQAALVAVRHPSRRKKSRLPKLRSLLRWTDEPLFHGRRRRSSGNSTEPELVFVVVRPGIGPEPPIHLLPTPKSELDSGALATMAALIIGGHTLSVPAELAEAGITGAVSQDPGALETRLDARDRERALSAADKGFSSIEIGRGGVVLAVRVRQFHPEEQLACAREWLDDS